MDEQADYVLTFKGNQGSLREDVELLGQTQKKWDFAGAKVTRHQSVEGDHGRIETRPPRSSTMWTECSNTMHGRGSKAW